jgi:hypothetical protein
MFTVHTVNDEILKNITFTELVRLSDTGEIFQVEVDQTEVISKEVSLKSSCDWHKVHLVISRKALSKLKQGEYGDRYGGIVISDKELEAAYCYKYEGNYNGTWDITCDYPVLDLDLKRKVEEQFFYITSRTPLSDKEIESLKAEVEALCKYRNEGAEELISSLTLEQKQALKQFYGLNLLGEDTDSDDDDYEYDD